MTATEDLTSPIETTEPVLAIRTQRAIWSVLAIAFVIFGVSVLMNDPRERPLVGDEPSHMMLTGSLAYGANFSYDDADLQAFEDIGWDPFDRPNVLFVQKTPWGWEFAKPYGLPIIAAPFAAVTSILTGIKIAQILLVGLTLAFSTKLLSLRFSKVTAAVVASLSMWISVIWMYAYSAHADLVITAAVAAALCAVLVYDDNESRRWLVFGAIALAFGLSEKPPLAFLFAPLLLVIAWKHRTDRATIGVAALSGVVTLAAALVPYWHASNWETWNAYTGERYVAGGSSFPFELGANQDEFLARKSQLTGDRFFNPSSLWRLITTDASSGLESFYYTLIGQHTGLLPFLPLFFAILLAAVLRRHRPEAKTVAVLVGLFFYFGMYAFAKSDNYFGGDQALGNRYAIQVAPFFLALVVTAHFSFKRLVITTGIGSVVGLSFLAGFLAEPQDSFVYLYRTTSVGEILPFEEGRGSPGLFECGPWKGAYNTYDDEEEAERIARYADCLQEKFPEDYEKQFG